MAFEGNKNDFDEYDLREEPNLAIKNTVYWLESNAHHVRNKNLQNGLDADEQDRKYDNFISQISPDQSHFGAFVPEREEFVKRLQIAAELK